MNTAETALCLLRLLIKQMEMLLLYIHSNQLSCWQILAAKVVANVKKCQQV